MSEYRVLHGDCREVMATLDPDSVDSIVCDPPYGLSFMGREWDHGVPGVPFWTEALRVAKPGAHLVAFGGTRTFHRLTVAIEDAGWEIRDCLSWLYGSGFPKSLDVSKAIDKDGGHWRVRANGPTSPNPAMSGPNYGRTAKGEAITPQAATWAGWGTALKPAWEPIILARKPFRLTVAANVQEHGTGAINVDGCRIGTGGQMTAEHVAGNRSRENYRTGVPVNARPADFGRWPANVVLDEEAARLLDAQSGCVGGGDGFPSFVRGIGGTETGAYHGGGQGAEVRTYADFGGASRFFYTAKASRSEREEGLDSFPSIRPPDGRERDIENPRLRTSSVRNHHPTVKPVDLMCWLVRLVTPPNGLVLDPFCGSGSTGVAAIKEGFRFIGIEREAEYVEIARRRIASAPLNLFADAAP